MSNQVRQRTPDSTRGDSGSAAARSQDPYERLLLDEAGILVSVILPLPDHRGNARESVRSWAREQSLPRDRYEVLVVADGTAPELEAATAELLTPLDQMVYGPAGNEGGCTTSEHGSLAVAGSSSPRRTALDTPTVSARWSAISPKPGSSARHVEARDSARRCWPEWRSASSSTRREFDWHRYDWSKLFVRGAALSREIYLRHGGLKGRYRLFAEPELSSRLHAAGHRIGYAPAAMVRHANMNTVAEMREALHDYARGEATFRLDHPGGERDQHFGTPRWWSDRSLLDPGIERHLWLSLLRCLAGPAPHRQWARRAWLRLLPRAVFGRRWQFWEAEWGVQWAVWRCWWWRSRDEKLFDSYMDLWSRITAQGAVHTLAEYGAAANLAPRGEGDTIALADVPEDWLTGFHAIESLDGERFRWSGSAGLRQIAAGTT